jgi:hypothetical protein
MEPVQVAGQIVIPAGTTVVGRLTEVGGLGARPVLTLRIVSFVDGEGRQQALWTRPVTITGSAPTGPDPFAETQPELGDPDAPSQLELAEGQHLQFEFAETTPVEVASTATDAGVASHT